MAMTCKPVKIGAKKQRGHKRPVSVAGGLSFLRVCVAIVCSAILNSEIQETIFHVRSNFSIWGARRKIAKKRRVRCEGRANVQDQRLVGFKGVTYEKS